MEGGQGREGIGNRIDRYAAVPYGMAVKYVTFTDGTDSR
jgi:hypothetical protein